MQYRAEIDGLRALAVSAVVLCHADLGLLPGGYLGVDVFFVISGYLITRIVTDDIERGRFSLTDFYERRARRILPALFVMMVACIPVAWITMMPDFLQNFGQSLVATTLFANNILLWITTGYWDLEAEFKPLLHTWSLGVEEQYYVLAPIALWLVSRHLLKLRLAMSVIATVVFFAGYLALIGPDPDFAFYQLPTRAWELMIGATVVLWERKQDRTPASSALALTGLALITLPMVVVAPGSQASAASVLIPCLGTALVLVFGRSTNLAGRVLSWGPVVGVGLGSYSLYLWHQPVFAFTRIVSLEPPSRWVMVAMIGVAGLLALLSWRYVERPFRNRAVVSRTVLAATLGPLALCLIGFGAWLHVTAGVPARVFPQGGADPKDATIAYNERGFDWKLDRFRDDGAPRLMIVGDSQARDFINIARESGRFDGYDIVYRDDIELCAPEGSGRTSGLLAKAQFVVVTLDEPLCERLMRRDARLKDKRVVFVGPKHFGYNLNPYVFVRPEDRPGIRADVPSEVVAVNEALKRALPAHEFVDILGSFSSDGTTIPIFDADGAILTPDRVHLTRAGARVLGERLFQNPAWNDFPPSTTSAGGEPTSLSRVSNISE